MSWYSFMEGASSTDEMLGRAHELGYDALALVDRNNITGALEFSEAATELGIKPIIGVTLMLSDHENDPPLPITLIAENRQGYANMCNLITFAHIAAGRIDPVLYTRYLQGRTDGIIALIGEPGSHIADAMIERFIDWFGKENLFIELQRHFVHGDRERNNALVALAERNEIEIVATGGVFYHERSRSRLHDVLTAIRHNLTLETSHRQRKPNSHYELKSPERMAQLFQQWPQAIDNTRRIADRCQSFNAKQINYRFPRESVPDEFSDEQEYLEYVCNDAAKRRYGRITEKVRDRLDREFKLIRRHGLAGFFLLYRRVISLAQDVAIELGHSSAEVPIEEKPPGRGRGSSVAMLIGTLIGLSHIDPLEYDLPLERFISDDELMNAPDIDLDFPRDIREQLILRVFEEFGWSHAALTAMLPTYKLKGVVRDVGKALGLPPLELDVLAKRAESHNASDIATEMVRIEEMRDKIHLPGWRDLIEIGAQLQGFPKGLAQHPGGMIISSTPLIDITPVQPSAMDGRYICQWDKHGADSAGFLKIDFLSLGALSQMQECLQLIEKRTGSHVDLSRIDFNDQAVYDDFARGDTVGVFQVESAAQMQTITRMKPRNLYDLALEVAAVRPGVGANDGVSEFIRRRNGSEWDYDHPLERRALEKSLGIILFQDQVVTLGIDVGGMTASESDQMRRAFQRRNNEALIRSYWKRFRDGASERGVPENTAYKIFLKFNPHYMFPEGHALAFGVTAYHMAWLRRHYPTEFYNAIFNAQPMGFWPLETLKQDAKRMGVTIYNPDVNLSEAICVPEGENAFRLGLTFVRGFNSESAKTLIENRNWNGPYRSLSDLVSRSGVQRAALENLVKAGACDELTGVNDRRHALWEVGLRYQASGSQGRLQLAVDQDMATLEPARERDHMTYEYETLGLWTEGHVMSTMRDMLSENQILNSTQLDDKSDEEYVIVSGKVLRRQRPLGKMIFMTLEDEFGMIPLAVPPDTWKKYRDELRMPIIVAEGRVSRKSGTMNIMVHQAWPLTPAFNARAKIPDISHNFR
ncbi:MAG: DNA polymerase III subunit alpha [Chloroflexi bacterium]|nr:DNA polymerase III subunit alpha [Chloroflexota bacterium]MYK61443.1 DNA polymerase III subunit alpha [Chloroflexota bacterium]